jgi:hypothetical protein
MCDTQNEFSIGNRPQRARCHGRMARGRHGLPKDSPGPAMPDPSMPCGRTTLEIALRPFLGWPAAQRPSSTLLDTPRRTPMSFHLSSYGRMNVSVSPSHTPLDKIVARLRLLYLGINHFRSYFSIPASSPL